MTTPRAPCKLTVSHIQGKGSLGGSGPAPPLTVSYSLEHTLRCAFSGATLRPSTITFVDTPALLDPFAGAPWETTVYDALKHCDVFYIVIRAFDDPSVEQWKSAAELKRNDSDAGEGGSPSRHYEATRVVAEILEAHDRHLVEQLRENGTLR